jgi:cytochrome b
MAAVPDAAPRSAWDGVIRLTHWGVAAAVVANGLVTEGGKGLHVWVGWAALALLALRLAWGFAGPAEARFRAFLPHPGRALGHLTALARGRPPRYASHNPAGAVMIWALWGTLAVVAATGLAMTGASPPWAQSQAEAAVEAGDWSAIAAGPGPSGAAGELAQEVHEVAANLLLVLAVLHVAGVSVESRVGGENLLAPMLPWARRRRRR